MLELRRSLELHTYTRSYSARHVPSKLLIRFALLTIQFRLYKLRLQNCFEFCSYSNIAFLPFFLHSSCTLQTIMRVILIMHLWRALHIANRNSFRWHRFVWSKSNFILSPIASSKNLFRYGILMPSVGFPILAVHFELFSFFFCVSNRSKTFFIDSGVLLLS